MEFTKAMAMVGGDAEVEAEDVAAAMTVVEEAEEVAEEDTVEALVEAVVPGEKLATAFTQIGSTCSRSKLATRQFPT